MDIAVVGVGCHVVRRVLNRRSGGKKVLEDTHITLKVVEDGFILLKNPY